MLVLDEVRQGAKSDPIYGTLPSYQLWLGLVDVWRSCSFKAIIQSVNINVSVNQEFLAWLKQPKLLQSPRSTLCPNKKHVTTFSTITLTISVRLQ